MSGMNPVVLDEMAKVVSSLSSVVAEDSESTGCDFLLILRVRSQKVLAERSTRFCSLF